MSKKNQLAEADKIKIQISTLQDISEDNQEDHKTYQYLLDKLHSKLKRTLTNITIK